ncbi:MAG: AmmeMemoRadiSam system radical SAM enzyme [Gemmatimonadota bacterium]|nr:MAG: AmmeMemoRadiSam system radical SAM enzyme [Gemmatimonadota bacterium]
MSTAPVTGRRAFLKTLGCGACAMCADCLLARAAWARQVQGRNQVAVHDAMWFETIEDNAVRCTLCPRECVVADVERGYCGVRENQGGEYKTLVYGTLCSVNVDPIEKKPLFHYLPATTALSVATPGCNMECKFCQNWEISQFRPEQVTSYLVPPRDVVQLAVSHNSPTIAYTYSEPVVFYEYAHDTAALGRRQGVGSVLISNGYILEEPLRQLCQHLTAVKVDLKAFTETFYADHCAASLAPVLDTLDVLADIGIHTEVVVLLIPTLNDSAAEIREMARWLVEHMGPDVPVHFSRFHPIYRMKNLPPTPVAVLERARRIALDSGLNYVYLGNVPFHEGESTYCPRCGKMVIQRVGYRTDVVGLEDGACASCGCNIPGVWTQEQALAVRRG